MSINKITKDVSKQFIKNKIKEIEEDILKRGMQKWHNEIESVEEFEKDLFDISEDELRLFVPDVYQKSIYKIDYDKLKENGIKLLSYDIDDTIDDVLMNNIKAKTPIKFTMPDDAKKLVNDLHSKGFIVVLITNAITEIAASTHEQLETDDYIARAEKPETISFEKILKKYGLDKSEMAHIGNSMRDDIYGGNKAGITTCLVRRKGWAMKIAKVSKKILGSTTRGKLIRKKLAEYDIWHKHHINEKNDQYYQLGEVQLYSKNFKKN